MHSPFSCIPKGQKDQRCQGKQKRTEKVIEPGTVFLDSGKKQKGEQLGEVTRARYSGGRSQVCQCIFVHNSQRENLRIKWEKRISRPHPVSQVRPSTGNQGPTEKKQCPEGGSNFKDE